MLVVVAIPAVLLMTWMGVEAGLAVRAVHQAHRAADAAALAAAARHADGHETKNQDALTAAQACQGPNGPVVIATVDAAGGGGDVVYGRWNETTRTFTPEPDGGPAARVTVRFAEDSPNGAPQLLLWGFFQGDSPSFTRSSVAVYNPPKHTTSMLLESQGSGALDFDHSATIVSRGGVSVASSEQVAVIGRGPVRAASALEVPVLRVAGAVEETVRGSYVGSIEEGAEIPADPMAGFELPPIDAGASGSITDGAGGQQRIAPGAHEQLNVTAGTVVLEAGVHQFTQAVTVSGSAEIVLEQAAIQLAPSATLSVTGSASITGSGLATGDWEGAWLMQRGAPGTWTLGGGARVDVQGWAYGPDAAVTVSGQASVTMFVTILGRLRVAEDAALRLTDRIEPLDQPVVPGRARLVR